MSVPLSALLAEIPEKNRNSTTGTLDNTKRTRGINRTLQDLQDYADWGFTRRTKTFNFIAGVNEYSLENYVGCTCLDNDGETSIPDFKNPHDLRPLDGGKSLAWHEDKEVRENIRRGKSIQEYAVENDLLIVNYPRGASGQVHNCDSLTADGTWAASGNASNLTVDELEYKEGTAALNFDAAGTSLILTNSTLTAQDYSELKNKSHMLVWVYLPSITNFSSIGLRWGSSASAYWEKTETRPAGQRALQAGWNLFAFRWASATETGSPDAAAVGYLRIALTYSSSVTATDFRVDDIRIGKEVQMELDYYSLAMVKDASGSYQLEFNADDVTMTDTLLGVTTARKTVVQGAVHDLFEIIGGKSERDRTDSFKKYEQSKLQLRKRAGRPIRRPIRRLDFAR